MPVIAHETGQRPVFPDYDQLLPKFTGPLLPLNLERYDRPVPMELRRPLSPTQLIDATLPPTWIFQGTADKVVPFAQVTEFRDRAKALGAA